MYAKLSSNALTYSMRRIKSLRLYARLSPSARYEIKSWNALWRKLAGSDSGRGSATQSVLI